MIAGCTIWYCTLFTAGLYFTVSICRAYDQGIASCRQWSPLPLPEYPAIRRKWRIQCGLPPGSSTIHAHLDLLDAAITGEGNTTYLDRLCQGHFPSWVIYPAYGVKRAVVPALAGIETLHEMIGEFNAC